MSSFVKKITMYSVILTMALIGRSATAQKIPLNLELTTKPGSTPKPLNLDINQAVQIALQNSKNLKIAAEAVQKSHGAVIEQKDGFLPSVNFAGTYTHLNSGASVSLPLGPNGQNVTVPIVIQDQESFSLTAMLPVDIMGLIKTSVDAAQFQEIAARLNYNATRNQLILNVKNAYYNVLRSQAYVVVAQQSLQNAEDQERTSQSYLNAGTGTRFDVLRSQTAVANALQSLLSAQNQVDLAIASLNNVLNIDQNTPLTLKDNTNDTPVKITMDQALTKAYANRPEVLQADASIQAAKKGVRLADRSMLPSLGLSWTGSANPNATAFNPLSTSWAFTAQVSVPIFDQGVSNARIEQAHADVNTAKINKQMTLDGIALQVRQAYLSLKDAEDRLKVTSAAMTEAQEQYRLAEVRFKEGVTQTPGGSPLLEISDAQTALSQAQTNQVNAEYDVANDKAILDEAMGLYAFDTNSKPGYSTPTQVKGIVK